MKEAMKNLFLIGCMLFCFGTVSAQEIQKQKSPTKTDTVSKHKKQHSSPVKTNTVNTMHKAKSKKTHKQSAKTPAPKGRDTINGTVKP